ncbi:MAG: PD40 domain-containing protein [Bryobacterales bacterium]|nr:PD40 domain-containing protein [Bryobacterales bacterium]
MLQGHSLYHFGEFTLDPIARVLFRNGEPVHMTRRTAETLLVLVEHAGQVLTKDEIMRAVWADRVVDEANLAQNIAVIRKTLAVGKGSPGWIETFPGRGYRLEGPVVTDGKEAPVPIPEAAPKAASAMTEPGPPAWLRRPWLTASLLSVATLGAFGAWWLVARKVPARTVAVETLPVKPATRLQGREYQPALSADGTRLAFLWAEEGSSAPSVWISGGSDLTPRRVSARQAHHTSPSWSPDGQHLAYLRVTKSHTEIVRIEVSGQPLEERIVAALPAPNYGFDQRLMDWSPDGQWLAVSHPEAPGRPPGIWLVSAADGTARLLTRPGSDAIADLDPRFSPDSSTVTFLRLLNRSLQEVFSVTVAGARDPQQVTRFGKMISGHDWLSGGRTLILASNQSGEYRLWKYPADGRGAPAPAAIYSEFPVQLSVARRGAALVYATLHQDRNIWRLNVRDGSWRRVIATTAQDASPVFSPDGKRIVFRSDQSGEEQIWVSNSDGSNPVQVTSGDMRPSVGRWSPDGRSLVFNNPRTFEIFVATEADGRWAARRLGARGVHPVFTSDGEWILAGGTRLVRIPVAGGGQQVLAGTRAESLAAPSDGRYVYFVREANGTAVWRLEFKPGAEPERVVDQLLPSCSSCWAVARDGVYYLGPLPEALDRQAIFFHSFSAPGKDRLVAEYPEPLWPHGSGPFSLSPDGQHLLVVRVSPSSGDVMRVEPFR